MTEPYFNGPAAPVLAPATIVALRAIDSNLFVDGQIVRILGLDFFEWDSSDSQADDGVDVIKPDDVSGAGRWLRIDVGAHFDPYISVGPGPLPTTGLVRLTKNDFITAGSENTPVIGTDSSKNVKIGGSATTMGSLFVDVPTGQTMGFRVNAAPVMTLAGALLQLHQPVALGSDPADEGAFRVDNGYTQFGRNSGSTDNVQLDSWTGTTRTIGEDHTDTGDVNIQLKSSGRLFVAQAAFTALGIDSTKIILGRPVELGSSVATTGDIRGGSAFALYGIDTGASVDVPLITWTSDDLLFGNNQAEFDDGTFFGRNGSIWKFRLGGADQLSVTYGGVALTVPLDLASYVIGSLPSGSAGEEAFATDDASPNVPVYHDGTNWRRVFDRAIASASGPDVRTYTVRQVVSGGAGATDVLTIAASDFADDDVVKVYADVTARDAANGESAAYERVASFEKTSGTVSQFGTTSPPYTAEEDGTWDCTLTLTTGDIVVQVTPDGTNNTEYNVRCEVVVGT